MLLIQRGNGLYLVIQLLNLCLPRCGLCLNALPGLFDIQIPGTIVDSKAQRRPSMPARQLS
ncbi:hypothetical protein SODG_001981 [Sodalis praecaptivus]